MRLLRWSLMTVLLGTFACSNGKDATGELGSDDSPAGNGDGSGDLGNDDNGQAGGGDNGGGDGSGNNGSGDNGGGNSGGDGDVCEEYDARAERTTPDMLIVLDRSGSMDQRDRWRHSVDAVRSITSELDDAIRFGLMLFPEPPPPGTVSDPLECFSLPLDQWEECLMQAGGGDACAPGKVNVPIGLGTSTQIAQVLNGTSPNGGTPTSGSLNAALDALGSSQDTPRYVLLVTDGQPTCPNADGGLGNQNALRADHQLTLDALDALREAGVLTYVIGYDTDEFADAMDEFAQHGGTERHRPVENEDELLQEFASIAGEIVSCTFVLDEVPPDPSYVLVTLDGQQLNLNDPNGWSIDGKNVTLQGTACETLQDGGEHAVNVKVRCEVVVPL